MQPDDALDRLLASWNPRVPPGREMPVEDVMRVVRSSRAVSPWRRWLARLDEAAQEWLPAPAALVPALGAVVLLLGAVHFAAASGRAREASALEWRDSVLRPASPLWIASAHRDLVGGASPANP